MSGTAIEPRSQAEFDHLAELGRMLQDSGFFKDTKSVAQAAVKVQAGRELGLGPVESMRAFHIVEGKVEMSADLLASLVKASDKYDYTVNELTREVCRIQFWQEGEELGESEFTMEDARAGGMAGKDVWKKYPRNMLFARAMSNGVAWFCPDVTRGGRLYVEGEVGGEETPPALSVVDVGEVATVQRENEETVVVDLTTGEIVGESGADSEAEPGDGADSSDEDPPGAPDPSTPAQRTKLALLAKDLGWTDDERRARAGVESFTDLTKTDASRLIEAWGELAEAGETDAPEAGSDPEASTGSAPPGPPAASDDSPATPELWTRMLKHVGRNKSSVMAKAKAKFGEAVTTAESLTVDQAVQLLEEALL